MAAAATGVGRMGERILRSTAASRLHATPRPGRPARTLPGAAHVTLDPLVLLALVGALSVAALINGMVGLGFALLSVNVLAFVLGAKDAVIVMSLLTPLMSGLQLIRHRAFAPIWRRFRWMLVWALAGSVVGTQLLVILPGAVISLALGAFTVWYVVNGLREERAPLAASTERRLAPVTGLVGGITNSTIGASGPVFASYLGALGLRGREFAFAISLFFCSMGLLRFGLIAAFQLYTVPLALTAMAVFVPAALSQWAGFWLQGRFPARTLYRIVLVILLVASINLLWRGLTELLAG
jgi:uncharacterized protein